MKKKLTAGIALMLAFIFSVSAGVRARQSSASITKPDASALKATGDILTSVSRLRRLDIKRSVKSGFKTHDEIQQSVIDDLDENTKPAEFEATSKALIKLGLIPRDFQLRDYVIKLLREQVAGFYEPKTQEFYLAAWLPISEQKTVMAHELVHALQDQHFNLRRFEKWPKGDADAELATRALIEGDATIVMFQYAAEQQKFIFDVTRMDSLTEKLLEQGDSEDEGKYPVLNQAPIVLRENLQFPYVYGAGFVQAMMKHSPEALNRSYVNLPASTEQIIHPDRYFAGDRPVKIEIGDLVSAMGEGWKRTDMDVNGEFGYQVVLSQFIDKNKARRAAAGWGGDRYALLENNRGGLVLAQYTTWDSAEDAKEFFDSYSERTEKRYGINSPADPAASPRIYETSEGLASIELRDKDVVIIEGAENREQLARLSAKLWLSKKTVK